MSTFKVAHTLIGLEAGAVADVDEVLPYGGGPLMISALQQAHFLLRLASDDLPVSPEHQRAARDILLLERGDGYALYGKTGWVFTQSEELGWWVGWVEREGQTHAFALNIDLREAGDADKRQPLGRAILAAEGLLP